MRLWSSSWFIMLSIKFISTVNYTRLIFTISFYNWIQCSDQFDRKNWVWVQRMAVNMASTFSLMKMFIILTYSWRLIRRLCFFLCAPINAVNNVIQNSSRPKITSLDEKFHNSVFILYTQFGWVDDATIKSDLLFSLNFEVKFSLSLNSHFHAIIY